MRGICFIGAGKMATAIAGGMVRKNIKTEIHTFDPFAAAAEQFCKLTGGTAHPSPVAALEHADVILLAVKPQYLTEAVAAFREAIGERLVISIVAGATIASLEALTGTRRIVRVMPNTPALVGEGMSCIAASEAVPETDLAETETLLSAVGLCRRVSEKQLDAVTGLSGSGPAFVLEFIQALADGGVYAGLPRATAIELAVQTVLGSAKMARDAKTPIGELRDAVISPAGTTSRGVMELAKGAFSATVAQAVAAAADRSAELGALSAEK
ncbi:MAG: pyrroline-5-carboxylate reductase [Victivallales bacterium]|jgi:pyrroline-5-carboxylate reductase